MTFLENLLDLINNSDLDSYWRSFKLYPAVRASLWENSPPCPVQEDIVTLVEDTAIEGTCESEKDESIASDAKDHTSEEDSDVKQKGSAFGFITNIINENTSRNKKSDTVCDGHGFGDTDTDAKSKKRLKHHKRMAPPYYADLGKKANDVFSKGYHFGVFKLDLKTKSESGVEFSSGIISNHESGKVFGSLQSKYSVKDLGLSFTEKWNTDNTLATDVTIQDKIAAGLKLTLEGTFAPQTGYKTGKLKTSYVNETVALNSSLDLNRAGPVVDVAGVLHLQGWLAGVHGQFDSQKSKFTKNNVAFGYVTKDFNLHTNIDNGKEFGGSIYQKVNEKIDCGISMKWTSGTAETLFGVGAKLALDADASLHAKVNNKSLIGLGYQQKLRPGVVLTLSAAIDGQNFNAGGHKIGVALELEP